MVSIPIWCDYKQKGEEYFDLKEMMFQFQYGAIIRSITYIEATARIVFQFQYGAIIRKMENLEEKVITLFQFQYGAIISEQRINKQSRKAVSIPIWCDYKLSLHRKFGLIKTVSIPIWCDYKQAEVPDDILTRGFNSNMVRL